MKTTTERDYNSIKNQSIKGKLVEREIYTNLNQTIEALNKCEGHDWQDEITELLYSVDTEQMIINYLDTLDGQAYEWKV